MNSMPQIAAPRIDCWVVPVACPEAAIERNLPRALTGSHGMSPAFEFLKMA
jgi:hypothetical protein